MSGNVTAGCIAGCIATMPGCTPIDIILWQDEDGARRYRLRTRYFARMEWYFGRDDSYKYREDAANNYAAEVSRRRAEGYAITAVGSIPTAVDGQPPCAP